MSTPRQLYIPPDIPEDFANAVATVLLLGIAGAGVWDLIFHPPPETSLAWIESILRANNSHGLVHPRLQWWEFQVRGH